MHPSTPSSLPPLPSSLSTRLLSTINPQTGACKHHPAVQLCELVDHNSRWIVRRKICSKCGARAPVGVSRRMPGVSVVNPSSSNNDRIQIRTTSLSPQPRPSRGRSRSASTIDRPQERSTSSSRLKTGQDVIITKSDFGGERQRTSSIPSRLRERKAPSPSNEAIIDHHPRSRSASVSRQRILIEAALLSAKTEASNERGYHGGGGVSHRSPPTDDALAVVPSTSLVPSFHSRALEFTSKALTVTASPPLAPRDTSKMSALFSSMTDEQRTRDVDKFDESDPYIIIPVIDLSVNSTPPPPPPRSPEEMALHMERLKLRQANLRKEYQARRAKMAVVTRSSETDVAGATDPPAAAELTSRSRSRKQDRPITKRDAKQSVNHGYRFSREIPQSDGLKVTSSTRSPRATSRRDCRSKNDSKKSKPESTPVLASTTRARPANHLDSSRDEESSNTEKKLPKIRSRSRSIEKTPQVSKGVDQDKRRSSSRETKHSSRSKSIVHRSRSLSKTREGVLGGDEGHCSDRSRAFSRKSSKEGRSTVTGSTRPESVSSTSQSKSSIKIVLSRSMSKEAEEANPSEPIVFQRKKRAQRQGGKVHSKNNTDSDSRSHRSQPIALVQCSSDEQSHASSISESIYSNDFDVKDRPDRLSFTKSGAKQFVSRSKSALGGIGSLNSARRKFQSALLV